MGAPFLEGEELMIRCIMPRGGGLNGNLPVAVALPVRESWVMGEPTFNTWGADAGGKGQYMSPYERPLLGSPPRHSFLLLLSINFSTLLLLILIPPRVGGLLYR